MLKAFLVCLLVSVAVSPTYIGTIIHVGMTQKQVEAILGEPSSYGSIHLGHNSNADVTISFSSYDNLSVYFRRGIVLSVDYR